MITVLTPTYNRAYILPKLYASLENQTLKGFEWIVIDDGSSDNTEKLVKYWISKNNLFKITYIKQENGGKHRALNYGIKMARYEYCFIVDSDDYLAINAIECICVWVKTIDDDNVFAGVSGLRGYIDGGRIGNYPKDKTYVKYIDATNLQRQRFNLGGDKAEVYRTKILRKYPFPEFEGENFMTEEVVWNAIANDGYKLRWFNEIIYLGEYIEDGLTQMGEKKFIDNFNGYTYCIGQNIKLQCGLSRVVAVGRYVYIAKKKGMNLKDSAKILGIPVPKMVALYMIWNGKNYIKLIIKSIRYKLNGNGESE